MILPEDVLDFWFPGATQYPSGLAADLVRWFEADPAFDRLIEERFGAMIGQAERGELAAWRNTSRGRLALIILLDQFPRNVFRGTPKAFSYDIQAGQLCLEGLALKADLELSPVERLFFYLPLLHSESGSCQKRSIACFQRLAVEAGPYLSELQGWVRIARDQRLIVAVFGRLPHRNKVLGRRTTFGERLFLFYGRLKSWLGDKFASARSR